ncbi:phage gp6-like head-tail connector protein [Pseudomonas sp. PA-7-1E]|uniref:head-tail connector protein n=1 Tax=unclassified Pseudomonas TaxID=196821 RepID=UPI0006D46327|nr:MULTISPECIES: head-tail connector protein [unclassified Pseudomonas]MCF5044292.1 phage gp6-like head-tail connector protein [Pseudomonas sp. PA-7-1E]MCF5132485.1 phage gp6-like head-tail connector protein [Pseudomonas sp. PA-6-4F]
MIDLPIVKAHLRVDHDDEDALIEGYRDAALSAFETWTNRTLVDPEGTLPDPVGNALLMTKAIKQGALMLIGHWYSDKESVVIGGVAVELPMATSALWKPHRWVNI